MIHHHHLFLWFLTISFQVLKFVTECIAKKEFEVLEEKLSAEALEKARSIAQAESNDGDDNYIIFKGTSQHLFFQSETRFFTPWLYTAEKHCKSSLIWFG